MKIRKKHKHIFVKLSSPDKWKDWLLEKVSRQNKESAWSLVRSEHSFHPSKLWEESLIANPEAT